MSKGTGRRPHTPAQRAATTANSHAAKKKRLELEARRRAGEVIPRPKRKGSRGPAPWAEVADAAPIPAPVPLTPDVVAEPTAAEEVQALVRRLEVADLGTAIGRLDHRSAVNALLARGVLDAPMATAFIALGKAQARDANPGDAKRRPRVDFRTITTRAEAKGLLLARDVDEATQ